MPRPSALAAALLLAAAPAVADELHPQDGPDADVRVRIDERAVRFQIVLNLAFLDEIAETEREREDALHPLEYDGVHQVMFEALAGANEVEIDGVVVAPVDRGFEVLEPDLTLLPLFPLSGTRGLWKLTLQLEYPCEERPQEVRFRWGHFPRDWVLSQGGVDTQVQINAQLLVGASHTVVPLRAEAPEHVWRDPGDAFADRFLTVPHPPESGALPLPLGSLGAVLVFLALALATRRRAVVLRGAPVAAVAAVLLSGTARVDVPSPFGAATRLPDADEARRIFEPLHANIYRAFDYVEESDVYDSLARSVHGDLLAELYDQVYRSLVMQEHGGALSRVESVRHLETTVGEVELDGDTGLPRFEVTTRWQVDGAVYHWGHVHARTNEALAEYAVVGLDDGWRIARSQVLEQTVVEAAPVPQSPRALAPPPLGPGEDL